MKVTSAIKELWTCPKCGRQFEREGQLHSCRFYALEQHFVRKETGRLLYEAFKKAVEKQVGPFKVESLECCIHFFSTFTFAAVKIFKDKIRVDFSLSNELKSERIQHAIQMSSHRYLYYIDIKTANEMDAELMQWVQEAYDLYKR